MFTSRPCVNHFTSCRLIPPLPSPIQAVSDTGVLTTLVTLEGDAASSEDLKTKCRRALKSIIGKLTHLPALDALVHKPLPEGEGGRRGYVDRRGGWRRGGEEQGRGGWRWDGWCAGCTGAQLLPEGEEGGRVKGSEGASGSKGVEEGGTGGALHKRLPKGEGGKKGRREVGDQDRGREGRVEDRRRWGMCRRMGKGWVGAVLRECPPVPIHAFY